MAKGDTQAFREVLEALRHAQMVARMDANNLLAARRRCRVLAAQLRALRPRLTRAPRVADGLRPLAKIRPVSKDV